MKYTYNELRLELVNSNSTLDKIDICEALDYMELHNHDVADFGFMGMFLYSKKSNEVVQ